MMRFVVALFVAAILLLPRTGNATTYTATSCSSTHVQEAMTSASSPGDVVEIPACAGTGWTAPVSWTAPANATLKGAGTSTLGGGDVTVIVDNYAVNAALLVITINSSGTFRMTGLTIQGGSGVHKDNGLLVINGPGTARLDHIHLNSQSYSPARTSRVLHVGLGVVGVLDHSILDLNGTSAVHIANGTDSKGNAEWAAPSSFGGSNFFFIEDSQINGTPATFDTRIIDCYTGGRYVVRFNSFTASTMGEDHATGHASDDRGCRAHEVYGNSAVQGVGQTTPNHVLVDIGGGTAMLWGNSAPAAYKGIFNFNVTRKNDDTYAQLPVPDNWGYCGTAFNGTGSAWDGSAVSATGYPCIDQPGRGQGDLLTGSFPNKVNQTTGTIAYPNQALDPIYIFKNDATPVPGWGDVYYSNQTGGRVVADQDYYQQASGIQTTASSPFNGTTGVGWGTLANRPTTCTSNATTKVGYFATDQGSWNTSASNPYGVQQNGASGLFYQCSSPNVWTLHYTPFTYPHPLVGSAPAASGTTTVGGGVKFGGGVTIR